ncbi:inositol-1,4,5-trisphosphate 5-phosphatase 1 [Pseudozyma hubeiensis SY62]|uniref:Inositol-1,4,5-trisphosphate 5-phosphatase 1 n=1 Tax=Pseudozyma hubeiensis (strain SY62) TaxID=1305764 RepID=R9PH15_PSEHS|nr:inositol-1,4,5-trisphosphate 5-phosphatase 1 [Pseudozyma hubeiensis SY62]GAC97365.1 inositol-1,4,5-trisphosphate 5-phosphatase 1 [Pseudozyma hubeiensis SY62]
MRPPDRTAASLSVTRAVPISFVHAPALLPRQKPLEIVVTIELTRLMFSFSLFRIHRLKTRIKFTVRRVYRDLGSGLVFSQKLENLS